MSSINIFWFRRDLRLEDNTGLSYALKSENKILPLFIFDSDILDHLEEKDARVEFIHSQIRGLHTLLGIHLRFGSLSIRELVKIAVERVMPDLTKL